MQVTVEDLIRGMVIQSGNDASVALAEHVAGSEEAFREPDESLCRAVGHDQYEFHEFDRPARSGPLHHGARYRILSAATVRDFPDYYPWYSEKEFTFNKFDSTTGIRSCGVTRPSMASRPGIQKRLVIAWRPRPSATACAWSAR